MVLAIAFLIVLAQPPIRLSLDKRVCLVPCAVQATVTIPAHDDNREASLWWDGGSSEWTLSATTSPQRYITLSFTDTGTFTVYAVLLRRDRQGKRTTFEDSLSIIVEGRWHCSSVGRP